MNRAEYIWIDGAYLPTAQAGISPLSQTFHYGFGVYEGIRSYETHHGAAIFRLTDHLDRLFYSASLLKITIPYSKAQLAAVHHEILQKNNLQNAYLRPVVFMGDEYLGLHTQRSSVHMMIAAIPWSQTDVGITQKKQGVSVKTVSYEKLYFNNHLHKAKANGMYLISLLANNEAQEAGFQEALLLDKKGYVAEGSGANIFMVKNNVLYTPYLDFVLDGITRKTVIALAKDQGIPVVETNITLDTLYQADELFFTGTAAEILPIASIDTHEIAPGEITEKMRNTYKKIVTGDEPAYRHWLNI